MTTPTLEAAAQAALDWFRWFNNDEIPCPAKSVDIQYDLTKALADRTEDEPVVADAGQPLPIEKVIEWASQAGFTWRNPARDRCLAEFADLVHVFGSAPLRELSDEDLDAAIDRSGWPQNMISDFIRDKLREACRFALAAAAGKVNSKVNHDAD